MIDPIHCGAWLLHLATPEIAVIAELSVKLLVALLLGVLVGYERFYHGHAAGMRTYGLVCMASSGLVALAGNPEAWFNGHVGTANILPDPTRIIQGIMTGIGFLGAGVIVHEKFYTRGLTSAASIWASSVIGVMVGIGYYPVAAFMTVLATLCMVLVKKIERKLPSNQELAVVLRFRKESVPSAEKLQDFANSKGYKIPSRSFAIKGNDAEVEWHFILVAVDQKVAQPVSMLADDLQKVGDIIGFHLAHARN